MAVACLTCEAAKIPKKTLIKQRTMRVRIKPGHPKVGLMKMLRITASIVPILKIMAKIEKNVPPTSRGHEAMARESKAIFARPQHRP